MFLRERVPRGDCRPGHPFFNLGSRCLSLDLKRASGEIIRMTGEALVPSAGMAAVSTAAGWLSHWPLSKMMLTAGHGVRYYGEAHRSRWNAWIHTLGMPVSIYGLLMVVGSMVPARFGTRARLRLLWVLYYLYGGHYLRMGVRQSIPYYVVYAPVTWFAVKRCARLTEEYQHSQALQREYPGLWAYLFEEGITYSTGGLLFQEVVGHKLGGDMSSREEGVPNAILYAMYFSISHMCDLID